MERRGWQDPRAATPVAEAMAMEERVSFLRACAGRLHCGAAVAGRACDALLRVSGRSADGLCATVLLFRHDTGHRIGDRRSGTADAEDYVQQRSLMCKTSTVRMR